MHRFPLMSPHSLLKTPRRRFDNAFQKPQSLVQPHRSKHIQSTEQPTWYTPEIVTLNPNKDGCRGIPWLLFTIPLTPPSRSTCFISATFINTNIVKHKCILIPMCRRHVQPFSSRLIQKKKLVQFVHQSVPIHRILVQMIHKKKRGLIPIGRLLYICKVESI